MEISGDIRLGVGVTWEYKEHPIEIDLSCACMDGTGALTEGVSLANQLSQDRAVALLDDRKKEGGRDGAINFHLASLDHHTQHLFISATCIKNGEYFSSVLKVEVEIKDLTNDKVLKTYEIEGDPGSNAVILLRLSRKGSLGDECQNTWVETQMKEFATGRTYTDLIPKFKENLAVTDEMAADFASKQTARAIGKGRTYLVPASTTDLSFGFGWDSDAEMGITVLVYAGNMHSETVDKDHTSAGFDSVWLEGSASGGDKYKVGMDLEKIDPEVTCMHFILQSPGEEPCAGSGYCRMYEGQKGASPSEPKDPKRPLCEYRVEEEPDKKGCLVGVLFKDQKRKGFWRLQALGLFTANPRALSDSFSVAVASPSDMRQWQTTNGISKLNESFQLKLKLLRARDLPSMDRNGLSDPYVKCKIGEDRKRTDVIKKTLNPDWNAEFTFAEVYIEQVLEFKVKDYDHMSKDDKMGHLSFSLTRLVAEQSMRGGEGVVVPMKVKVPKGGTMEFEVEAVGLSKDHWEEVPK